MRGKLLIICVYLYVSCIADAQLIKGDFLTGLTIGNILEKDAYPDSKQGPDNPIKPNQWNRMYHATPGGVSPEITDALLYKGYIGSTHNNHSISLMKLESGARRSVFSLADNSVFSKGTYYLSFLLNVGTNTVAGDNVVVISFDGTYTGNFQRIGVCIKTVVKHLTFQFGIAGAANNNDPAQYAPVICDFNTTYLVVLKYDFTDGKADLFINPVISGSEPDPVISITNNDLGRNGIRAIVLNQRTNFSAKIGSLRLAHTWNDLLGLDPIINE